MQRALKISMPSARVNARLSQEEMAYKMGVTRQTISNWESGKVIPGIAEFNMYANICNIPTDNIILPSALQKVNN